MYLPVDREVDLSLRSVDVIHDLFVPSLRFKQDAVPGLNIHMHFKPTQIGEYEIACAELCGLGHYKMHGMVHVVSQQDYDKWLAAREAEKQQWRPRLRFIRTLLKGLSENTFSAWTTK